ncbi:membrane protein required for colicin V production [Mariniphaga anaerophila]|uniref:Membrane protein required for colicin V production n=1 Tax=Mariniphaga anaerophila TaxID=1484053 RepID=A0A1M5CQ89_9BACT|nr:CvpA family protein [Mariniphaga anaerophila]SHF56572.1 membrane protein required for colicin V production [Mariniphaga anaerophila]
MNYIDIILGIVLLVAAIGGFRKGLVSELASLAALILGIWGAIEFSYITSDFLTEHFNLETDYLNIISFVVTFVVIVILVHVVGSSVNKLIEVAMLGVLNKLAGLVFGILRSALVLSIVLLVFDKIDEDVKIISNEAKAESKLYEPVRKLAPAIFPFIRNWDNSENGKDENENVIDQIKDAFKA